MNGNGATRFTYFLLRVVSGLLYFQHGGMKLLGWFGGTPGGQPELMTQIGIGGALEFFCGIAIMVGLFTRPMAFLMSGQMAVAYFQFHFKDGFWPAQNHGGEAVLFCFIFLFIAAAGGGAWSLDAMFRGKKGSAARDG